MSFILYIGSELGIPGLEQQWVLERSLFTILRHSLSIYRRLGDRIDNVAKLPMGMVGVAVFGQKYINIHI